MKQIRVIVLGFDESDDALARLAADLRQAWTHEPAPQFEILDDRKLSETTARDCDALVVMARPGVSESRVLRAMSDFEEQAVPVLAIASEPVPERNPFRLAGAMIICESASAQTRAEALRALIHRQQDFVRLRGEMHVAQRFQGGLNGQITKMHDELRLAAMVQREMLPHEMPHVHGVNFAALWRPVNYVSGDIYDVLRLDEDHVGIFLADAVGHGVPAALMTMSLRQSLHPREFVNGSRRLRSPSDVLRSVNQAMIERQSGQNRFATAVYGLLDCRSRVLTIAGAGHPPPLLIKPDGSLTELQTDGALLGVFPDEKFPQIETELAVDDRLLLFSDGFELVFPHPEHDRGGSKKPTTLYLDEFRQLVHQANALRMIDAIAGRVDSQRGSLHQVDDLTLICVHAGPIDAPKSSEPHAEIERDLAGARA